MHTAYSKISAKERDTAPRYYYKRTQSYTCVQRIKRFIRFFLAFLFTQVGVCLLIAVYMVLGAFLFSNLEAKSQMKESLIAADLRRNFTRNLWNVTLITNTLYMERFKAHSRVLIQQFQGDIVENVRNGYTGAPPDVPIWTFSSSLMYSLTVFTTIGYGNLTPRTDVGKIMTIVYALVGIPLMLLYMTNIGHILGSSFKYTYSKLCRCRKKQDTFLPSRAVLPTVLTSSGGGDPYPESSQNGSPIPNYHQGEKSKNAPKSFSILKSSKYKNEESGKKKQKTQKSFQDSEAKVGDIEEEFPDVPEVAESQPRQNEERLQRPTSILTGGKGKRSLTSNSDSSSSKRGISSMFKKNSNSESSGSKKAKSGQTVEFKLVEDIRLVTVPVTSCLFVLIFYMVFGMLLFSSWEGWSYMDGIYFCFTSLLTIGFGDFVPGNDYIYQVDDELDMYEARAKMILGTVYILLGMALVAMCLNLMQEKIIDQVRKTARRIGLLRPTKQ